METAVRLELQVLSSLWYVVVECVLRKVLVLPDRRVRLASLVRLERQVGYEFPSGLYLLYLLCKSYQRYTNNNIQ